MLAMRLARVWAAGSNSAGATTRSTKPKRKASSAPTGSPVSAIIKACKDTLEQAAPELAADLVNNGIVLAGGGALLRNIDRVISQATGLETRVANDPLTCVAQGTSIYLENLEAYKDTLESDVVDF
jgi:actin-like ATPase involved in cell morphogenesis